MLPLPVRERPAANGVPSAAPRHYVGPYVQDTGDVRCSDGEQMRLYAWSRGGGQTPLTT